MAMTLNQSKQEIVLAALPPTLVKYGTNWFVR